MIRLAITTYPRLGNIMNSCNLYQLNTNTGCSSPSDNCPPATCQYDATQLPEFIYRFVSNKPPTEEDFLTAFEQNKKRRANPCVRKALSVFLNKEDHEHALKVFRRRPLYLVTLKSPSGIIKNTFNPHHYSWWSDQSPQDRCNCVIEEETSEIE